MGMGVPEEKFIETIQFISDRFRKRLWEVAEPYLEGYGLHSYHIPVLNAVGEHPGISQKGLRGHVSYDKSRISTIIFELSLLDMVKDGSDSKTSSLHLTDKGTEVYDGIHGLMFGFCQNLFKNIPEDELDLFLGCLSKINDNLSVDWEYGECEVK